ncbi:hypothetical protein IAT38_000076 [Cryptococcus sp. DSM 104549]
MASAAKLILPVVKPALRYLPLLPTPLLTLPAALGLHVTTHPSPSVTNFVSSSTTSPLHLPLIFLFASIPCFYLLGLATGNVSWVDRAWPLYPPVVSAMIIGWAFVNETGGIYGHNLPRLFVMFGLQLIWSARLTSHAIKRGFYNPTSEDYRYTVFRKLVPRFVFALIHIFVIATAQPALLFFLSLPLHKALVMPPAELAGGWGALKYGSVVRWLPEKFKGSAPASTPVLNAGDYTMILIALGIIFVEAQADKRMNAFQSAKHDLLTTLPPSSPSLITPPPDAHQPLINKPGLPKPSSYPAEYHPGFPTRGMWRFSRHPNFAAEQLFWVSQAMFVVCAGESSGVTRSGWGMGSVFGPSFALSLLFLASTTLTEWISSRKYPAYQSYKGLVGQFLPQETALIWLWGTITGKRSKKLEEVYTTPVVAADERTD